MAVVAGARPPPWPWAGQNELGGILVQPSRPLRAGAAAESARLEIPETPATVPNPDLPDARPLPGQAGAQRDAQVRGTSRGVGIACHRQRAGSPGGAAQQAPGHRLIALRPAPARAYHPVEQDHLQRPCRGAFGQHRQVTDGNPAIGAPQPRVIGRRLAGEERLDHWWQVIGPFQGQAGQPERLHERPDKQGSLTDAVHLAQQQQAGGIQRPPGRRQRRRLDHQAEVLDRESGHCCIECIQRRDATRRHAFSMTPDSRHQSPFNPVPFARAVGSTAVEVPGRSTGCAGLESGCGR